jgi:hypothetical protein
MKKETNLSTGFIFKRTKDKVIIEMPISNLINGLESDPNNLWEGKPRVKINRKMKDEFADWLIGNIQDETDDYEEDFFITKMLSDVFQRIFEGYEDFAIYSDDEDE